MARSIPRTWNPPREFELAAPGTHEISKIAGDSSKEICLVKIPAVLSASALDGLEIPLNGNISTGQGTFEVSTSSAETGVPLAMIPSGDDYALTEPISSVVSLTRPINGVSLPEMEPSLVTLDTNIFNVTSAVHEEPHNEMSYRPALSGNLLAAKRGASGVATLETPSKRTKHSKDTADIPETPKKDSHKKHKSEKGSEKSSEKKSKHDSAKKSKKSHKE